MSHESTELVLWVDNTEPIYREKLVVFRALARRKDRGLYDPRLAPKAFARLLETAAKDYCRVFGSRHDMWYARFSPIARCEAARDLTSEFENWYEVDYPGEKVEAKSAKRVESPSRGSSAPQASSSETTRRRAPRRRS